MIQDLRFVIRILLKSPGFGAARRARRPGRGAAE